MFKRIKEFIRKRYFELTNEEKELEETLKLEEEKWYINNYKFDEENLKAINRIAEEQLKKQQEKQELENKKKQMVDNN